MKLLTSRHKNANAFASTFLFFAAHRQTLKNKKELASQRTWTPLLTTFTADFEVQTYLVMQTTTKKRNVIGILKTLKAWKY